MKTILSRGLRAAILISVIAGWSGCGAVADGPKETDVPCFVPEQWTNRGLLHVRAEHADGSGKIFLTQQTLLQRQSDNLDGQEDFSPHDAVYQFDPTTEILELVDGANWDNGLGVVYGNDDQSGDSPFQVVGTSGRPPLLFERNPRSVEGGTAVLVLNASSQAGGNIPPVVAVVSATGTRSAPFLSSGQASGQHYHQLYSEETGQSVGPPVRIGVGGHDFGPVAGRWVGARYVVYYTKTQSLNDLICLVSVQDVLIDTTKSIP